MILTMDHCEPSSYDANKIYIYFFRIKYFFNSDHPLRFYTMIYYILIHHDFCSRAHKLKSLERILTLLASRVAQGKPQKMGGRSRKKNRLRHSKKITRFNNTGMQEVGHLLNFFHCKTTKNWRHNLASERTSVS
jgi:hypothetical protein